MRLWLTLILVMTLMAPTPAVVHAATATARPADLGLATYRALLIGVQDYDTRSGIPDLRTPDADVAALSTLLRDRYGFTDVRTLTGPQATRAGILDALRALRTSAGPDDAVLVYYAGHGVRDDAAGQGYWFPVDASKGSSANWISNADVRDALKALPARHVLLLSDACFSGSLIGMRDLATAEAVGDLASARRLAGKRSRWVVTSGGNEPVLDQHLSTGHSVFAYYLLQVLEEQREPYVNLGAFLDPLQRRVINNAPHTPEAAPLRMAGDDGGQLVLINQDTGDSAAELPEHTEPVRAVVHLPDPGTLRVTVRHGGEVRLDGESHGVVVPFGLVELTGVSPGEHRVAVGDEVLVVEVVPGAVVSVELTGMEVAEPVQVTEPSVVEAPTVPASGQHEIEWVEIPGGSYSMGSDDGESDEKPVHTVTVSSFEIARTETTVAQFRACVEAGACQDPGNGWSDCNWGKSNHDEHPMNCVNWNQAQEFARWAGGRLPSEAEWEYAARGGRKRQAYPWGDRNADCGNSIIDTCGRRTRAVCSRPKGNTDQGLCDMAGNVSEFVQDWYRIDYKGVPRDGTAHDGWGIYRVCRGGSWAHGAMGVRVSARDTKDPSKSSGNLGFRIVRSVDSPVGGVGPDDGDGDGAH